METMHGHLSDDELKKIMERYVARDSDLILADAIQLYIDGKPRDAYETIAAAIVDDPVNTRLPLAMCKLLKHEQRYADAMRLIQTLPEKIRNEVEVSKLQDLLSFYLEFEQIRDIDSLQQLLETTPGDLSVLKQLCIHSVVQERYQQLQDCVQTIDAGNETCVEQQCRPVV